MRRATEADAPAIHALMLAAFTPFKPQYTAGCFDATVLDAPRIIKRIQDGPVWVIEDANQIMGTIGAVADERGVYVRGMAVHPDARRQRIGWRLLDAARAFGQQMDAACLWLSTTTFLTASQALYEAYGFTPANGPHDLHGTPLVSYELPLAPDP